jgi:DnaJ-class molecular chaperone
MTKHLSNVNELAKGDMYVKFNISFPAQLSTDQRNRLIAVLKEARES